MKIASSLKIFKFLDFSRILDKILKFPDFSLIFRSNIKFPDFSRFSRLRSNPGYGAEITYHDFLSGTNIIGMHSILKQFSCIKIFMLHSCPRFCLMESRDKLLQKDSDAFSLAVLTSFRTTK